VFSPPNLNGAKKIVFDCETTGTRWTTDKVVGYVLCWGPGAEQVAYFPVRHAAGGNLQVDHVERWLARTLERRDLQIVGHSLKFDYHMAATSDIALGGSLECTQVNEALIDENAGRYNLEDCSKRYRDIPIKRGEDLYKQLAAKFGGAPDRKSQIGQMYKLSGQDPLVQDYAKGDGTTTWHLHARQQEALDAQNLRKVWAVECRVLRVLWAMERRGVRVDLGRLAWLKTHLSERLREARAALPKDFNVRSAPQLEKSFHDAGVKEFKQTDKGNPSFVESWLEGQPLGQKVLLVRRIENLLHSFVNPLFKEHLVGDRVHTNFNQLRQDDYGVVTGRLSSNSPNMQQVPKRNKQLAPLFRMIFLPEEGHQWSANDYNQQEPRIFVDYIGNQKLTAGYSAEPPIDMHGTVAALLSVVRDPTAKRINMGLINGMGVKKLARSLGCSEQQARLYMEEYHREIPEAKRYLREAEEWAKRRGWVRTKLWRRRRFPDWRLAHKAGNAIVQGTAADMTKLKMCEIHDMLQAERAESYLMLQVHDELNWSLAPGEDRLDKQAREIMISFGEQDQIQFKVPHKVDYHLAEDWGRASFPDFDWDICD
jgi:DNA polymerase-1